MREDPEQNPVARIGYETRRTTGLLYSRSRKFYAGSLDSAFFVEVDEGCGEMDERFKSHAWKACIGL